MPNIRTTVSNKVIVREGDIEVRIQPSLTDSEREKFNNEQNDPVCMGVEIDEDEKAFLKLPQSMTDHSALDTTKLLTDVALMGSKLRMTIKSRLDEGLTEEQINNRPYELKREEAVETALITRVYDPNSKTVNFSKKRVTSMKTCRRVKIPDPLPEKEEAKVQSVISAIEAAITREAQRNKQLRSKHTTLTKSEAMGKKKLNKRTKKGEAAVVATDKSGRLSVMSKEEYQRKVSEHTANDPEVTQEHVKQLEQVLSATSASLARVLQMGEEWHQEDRVESAMRATLTSVPPLAILLKDHKPDVDKPVRPLCRSTESPNGPLSHITAQIMNIVATELNNESRTEVKSTEEMSQILDSVNDLITADTRCLEQCGIIAQKDLAKHMISTHPDHLPSITIGSMDVKALYPSLDIDHSCEVIKQLITQSEVRFNVNKDDLALHIAATHTQLEIDHLGLSEVVHYRTYKNGPRPLIISKSVTGSKTERENSDHRGSTQSGNQPLVKLSSCLQ